MKEVYGRLRIHPHLKTKSLAKNGKDKLSLEKLQFTNVATASRDYKKI